MGKTNLSFNCIFIKRKVYISLIIADISSAKFFIDFDLFLKHARCIDKVSIRERTKLRIITPKPSCVPCFTVSFFKCRRISLMNKFML